MGRPFVSTALVVLALVSGGCQDAGPGDRAPLQVFSSNGVKALLEEVRPALEQAAGRPVAYEFSTATDLARRIDGGAMPDVVVLTSALVDGLGARGKVVAGSRRDLAAVGVGVAVRAGAPRVEIGTPEALKTLLLGARSVAFTAEGQSRAAIDAAIARLDLAEAMRDRIVLKGPGEAPGAVARGEAEVVLTLMSELVEVPGLDVLGPFPADLQRYVVFTAARGATAQAPEAADRLLAALAGPDVRSRLARHGLAPAAP